MDIQVLKNAKELIIIFIILGLIMLYILLPRYDFTYYKLSSEDTYVTKVEYSSIINGNYTLFTEGRYSKREVPKALLNLFIPGGEVFMKSYFHLLTEM